MNMEHWLIINPTKCLPPFPLTQDILRKYKNNWILISGRQENLLQKLIFKTFENHIFLISSGCCNKILDAYNKRLGGFNNRHWFLKVLEARKFEIMVPTRLGFCEVPLPGMPKAALRTLNSIIRTLPSGPHLSQLPWGVYFAKTHLLIPSPWKLGEFGENTKHSVHSKYKLSFDFSYELLVLLFWTI